MSGIEQKPNQYPGSSDFDVPTEREVNRLDRVFLQSNSADALRAREPEMMQRYERARRYAVRGLLKAYDDVLEAKSVDGAYTKDQERALNELGYHISHVCVIFEYVAKYAGETEFAQFCTRLYHTYAIENSGTDLERAQSRLSMVRDENLRSELMLVAEESAKSSTFRYETFDPEKGDYVAATRTLALLKENRALLEQLAS